LEKSRKEAFMPKPFLEDIEVDLFSENHKNPVHSAPRENTISGGKIASNIPEKKAHFAGGRPKK